MSIDLDYVSLRKSEENELCKEFQVVLGRVRLYILYIYIFLAFLVKKTSGILIFGPSFRKPARKASSGEIYLKNKDLYATDL